jgi:DNA polymerase elongation subunit (family B)
MNDFYTSVHISGNSINYRGIENGKRIKRKIKGWAPTLYVETEKDTKYKTLFGKNLTPVEFKNIVAAKDFQKLYDGVENFPIYGAIDFRYKFLYDKFPNTISPDFEKVNTTAIDIEVACESGFPKPEDAAEEVLCITLKSSLHKEFVVFENTKYGDYKQTERTKHLKLKIIKCDSEVKLLKAFLRYWDVNTPDVITGWYIKYFDIPYLHNRIAKILGKEFLKFLSPWGKVYPKNVFDIQGKDVVVYELVGIATLDYMELYKKFRFKPREQYTLNFIANAELGEAKLSHEEFDSMHLFYLTDWPKFIDYNIRDTELIEMLEDKLKILEMIYTLAYDAKVNFEDVMSQLRMWDALVHNELLPKNIMVPPKLTHTKEEFTGAYVKHPQLGMHRNVVSFDLDGLYPHLQMQYNISPDTILGSDENFSFGRNDDDLKYMDDMVHKKMDLSYIENSGRTISPSGINFDITKQGFLPVMLERMYDDRAKYKKMMLAEESNLENIKEEMKIRGIAA